MQLHMEECTTGMPLLMLAVFAPQDGMCRMMLKWATLENQLGGSSEAGGKMKSTGTQFWLSPNTGATNSSGFSALPGGNRFDNGTFNYLGSWGYFWSSTSAVTNNAGGIYLYYDLSNLGRIVVTKRDGISVRCLRD